MLASESEIPNINEMSSMGMTAQEVNAIPESAMEKLYQNNTDILKVDIAIYMHSNSNKITPAVQEIKICTVDTNSTDALYSINIQRYDKADYRAVSAMFPIENFSRNAECYYLLYIGNEWMYTYKDGKLVKVLESADELLADIESSWISFKQYGMTAKEIRSIPEDVLNSLFVNKNYANSEFGIIYVVKANDETTANYTVDFKLQAETDYMINDDIVVEIVLNGNDTKVIDSNEFDKEDIEEFLAWIEAHQKGEGESFFILRNSNTQYFINYYMISSVNVYDGAAYRNESAE